MNDLYLNLEGNNNLLICGGISTYKRTIKCLQRVKSGFLLLKEREVLENSKPFFPVYKFKFCDQVFTLYKAVSFKDKTSMFKEN